jgi:hypothetical protein
MQIVRQLTDIDPAGFILNTNQTPTTFLACPSEIIPECPESDHA